MINNRRGIASGDVIFIAILLFLFVTGGFLVRNVVLNLQSPNMAKFDLTSEFQNLEQTILDTFALLTGKSPANQTTSPVIPDPAKKIEVTSIRFFEADKNAPAVKDRNYKTSFPRSSKIIYTEIGYKNNRHKIMDAEIPVMIDFYRSNGQKAGTINGVSRPKKEWATVLFVIRWPPPSSGSWIADQYTAKIFLDGKLVAEQKLEIN